MVNKEDVAKTTARLLYVLSPAKTLDMSMPSIHTSSLPTMLSDAHTLVTELRKLPLAKLKSLLSVSDAIAKLNHARFQTFEFVDPETAVPTPNGIHKQAVLAFHGPAYLGLAADELTSSELQYAQNHLKILCGLYGVLKPLDLIQAYRLEMGQKVANARGKDLYTFWGDRISHELNRSFAEEPQNSDKKILVNVASQEYFKSVRLDALDEEIQVVDCVFKDDGKIKSVFAKRARGLMCRYLITNQVDSLDGIKGFDLEGYHFSAKESDDATLVFNRSVAKQKEVLKEIQAKAKRVKEEKAAKLKSEEQREEEEDREGMKKKARSKGPATGTMKPKPTETEEQEEEQVAEPSSRRPSIRKRRRVA